MNTGTPAASANAASSAAASSQYTPLPAMTTGRLAPASSCASRSIAAGSPAAGVRCT